MRLRMLAHRRRSRSPGQRERRQCASMQSRAHPCPLCLYVSASPCFGAARSLLRALGWPTLGSCPQRPDPNCEVGMRGRGPGGCLVAAQTKQYTSLSVEKWAERLEIPRQAQVGRSVTQGCLRSRCRYDFATSCSRPHPMAYNGINLSAPHRNITDNLREVWGCLFTLQQPPSCAFVVRPFFSSLTTERIVNREAVSRESNKGKHWPR